MNDDKTTRTITTEQLQAPTSGNDTLISPDNTISTHIFKTLTSHSSQNNTAKNKSGKVKIVCGGDYDYTFSVQGKLLTLPSQIHFGSSISETTVEQIKDILVTDSSIIENRF